ncbi:hypothetical protein D1BOALGB6SA_7675 [Olavius sp. associated proteobacterium Delta 1]|nr:hypothetical protein D1BOALGB6SA_7675 [Olavius sp. associated proteobacterium Delta 1]
MTGCFFGRRRRYTLNLKPSIIHPLIYTTKNYHLKKND